MADDCEYPGPLYARFEMTTEQLKANMMCVAKTIRLDPLGWRNRVSTIDLTILADWIEQSVTARSKWLITTKKEKSMNIPWDKIIDIIIKLIEGCGEEATQEQVMAELQNPGPWTRIKLLRGVRSASGLSRREWVSNRSAIMEQVYEQGRIATPHLVEMLIDEATGH